MPIGNALERKIGEKNTRTFIDASYVEVELRRPRKERTEAGGVRALDPDILPTQRFRIVPMSGLVWDRGKSNADIGRLDDVTEQLICMPDADVKKLDYFPTEDGQGWFLINHVSPVSGYRKEARLRFVSTEPKSE